MVVSRKELHSTTLEHRYLTLRLSNEFLCLPIGEVYEISEIETVTAIPGTPPWLKGVVNLRGEIISVVDITSFLGLQSVSMTRQTRVIVVGGERYRTSLLADSVLEVLTIPPKEIKGIEEVGGNINRAYAKGVFVSRDLLYTILDVERLLACEPMMQFQ